MDQFRASWTALLAAVAALPNQALAEPPGCAGWLVRDLVCHLVIDAHLDDVGVAAGRAAASVRPDARVATRGQVLTAGDYLQAYVLEATLHHLDLGAELPGGAAPPAAGLAASRRLLERIASPTFPASFSDTARPPGGGPAAGNPPRRNARSWRSWPTACSAYWACMPCMHACMQDARLCS